MNNGDSLNVILDRVSPEHREAFLKSRMDLQKLHQDDEFLKLAVHMENFAGVICDLTNGIVPRSDDARELAANREVMRDLAVQTKEMTREFREARMSASVVSSVTRFHLLCISTACFITGGLVVLFIELIFSHLHVA
jgi:hypothetical protein